MTIAQALPYNKIIIAKGTAAGEKNGPAPGKNGCLPVCCSSIMQVRNG
ncbi:hypothetical protein I656_02930 [Geobacillus sp. WSUCF1]|nr:hypothetical protein I656_02930 [Geobacillus sp. WSUCF1]